MSEYSEKEIKRLREAKNHNIKVVNIQVITEHYTSQGVTKEFIFKNYIAPVFFVNKTTYYTMLARNAKAELRAIGIEWREVINHNLIAK